MKNSNENSIHRKISPIIIWGLWIGILLTGIGVPLGFIIALLHDGMLHGFTLGIIILIACLPYVIYDCSKVVFRTRPWKLKL